MILKSTTQQSFSGIIGRDGTSNHHRFSYNFRDIRALSSKILNTGSYLPAYSSNNQMLIQAFFADSTALSCIDFERISLKTKTLKPLLNHYMMPSIPVILELNRKRWKVSSTRLKVLCKQAQDMTTLQRSWALEVFSCSGTISDAACKYLSEI